MPSSAPSPTESHPDSAIDVAQTLAVMNHRRARLEPSAFVSACLSDSSGKLLRQAPVHDELQAFLSANRNAIVELPRDHGKTTQVCGRIVWELGQNPGLRVVLTCATETIARSRCRFLRQLIGGNGMVHRVFPRLSPAEPWSSTELTVARPGEVVGPSVSAFGIGAANTGVRCDLLVCDDVVAHTCLHSKSERDRTVSIFQNNLMNLLEPEGRCWCLCTPWHRDDLNARLKSNEAFALFRRAVGPELEPVWVEKWSTEALARRQTEVGEAAFARGYRLLPVTEDDITIKPEWVRTWTERPERFAKIVLAVDPAVSVKADADRSAVVVLGWKDNVAYCLDAVARRVRLPELVELIRTVDGRWHADRILFESNAAFLGIADLLKSSEYFGRRLESVRQLGAKDLRIAKFGERVRSGCFKLMGEPDGAVDPSQMELWDEMVSYPVGPRDDLVDAAAMGTEWLLEDGGKREMNIW